jgi:hypothetical protein
MGETLYGMVLTNFVTKFMSKVATAPGTFGITKDQGAIISRNILEISEFHKTFPMAMQKANNVGSNRFALLPSPAH